MFSNLTKASYVVPPWTYMGLLAMHRPIRFYLLHQTSLSKHLFAPSIYACEFHNTGFR